MIEPTKYIQNIVYMIRKISEIETPCYIFDIGAFRKNILDIREMVRSRYPNFKVAYSYKTNYYRPFLEEAMALGCYAEVVSPMEYELARQVGNPISNIIYNGVIPDFARKAVCANNGGLVNVENMPEMTRFINDAVFEERKYNIGIRVNFDCGNGLVSRFGFDVGGADFKNICDPRHRPRLKFRCVHFHFGGARLADHFRVRVRKCVEIARQLGASTIDIGGNIYGRMAEDFRARSPYSNPTLEEVCDAIGDEMAKACPERDIELIAECGTPVCSNAMHLLTSIIDIKTARGQTYITCDCRASDAGWSIGKYDPTRKYYGNADVVVSHAKVCGCECRENDVLIRDYNGPTSVGAKLLICNIGSYSYSQVNDFISPGCRVVYPIGEIASLKM